jgi:putative MATE family efflux protein
MPRSDDVRPGVIVQSATVILNMVLAPFLIFGWGTGHPLGAPGAALATLIAIVFGVIGLWLYILRRRRDLPFVARLWRPQRPLLTRLLSIGTPSGLELLLMSAYMTFIFGIIRGFGAAAQAGFNVGMRVMQCGVFPVMAVSFSLAAVAGQNFGARQRTRVRDAYFSAIQLGLGFMVAFTLMCHWIPDTLVGAFTRDAETIRYGSDYMRVMSLGFWAMSIATVNGGLFQALGNTWPSLMSSAVRLSIALIPAWLLSTRPGFQLREIWGIAAGSMVLHATLSSILLRREFLRKFSLQHTSQAAMPASRPA